MTKLSIRIILFLSLAVSTPLVILGSVKGQEPLRIVFSRTPPAYDNRTGYFTLGEQLIDDSRNGEVCLSYDYFVFNAHAGQRLQGKLESVNATTIYYVIITSIAQLPFFQRCGRGNSGRTQGIHGFRTQATLNWVAQKDGTYSLVFFVIGYYGGSVYFIQSPQTE